MTTETPMAYEVCLADHDHATDPACTIGAKEILRPLTAEEITQREANAKAFADRQAAEEAEAKAKADAKASAETKLAALGLTAEEIAALSA
jgi:hypothetical protein